MSLPGHCGNAAGSTPLARMAPLGPKRGVQAPKEEFSPVCLLELAEAAPGLRLVEAALGDRAHTEIQPWQTEPLCLPCPRCPHRVTPIGWKGAWREFPFC